MTANKATETEGAAPSALVFVPARDSPPPSGPSSPVNDLLRAWFVQLEKDSLGSWKRF